MGKKDLHILIGVPSARDHKCLKPPLNVVCVVYITKIIGVGYYEEQLLLIGYHVDLCFIICG